MALEVSQSDLNLCGPDSGYFPFQVDVTTLAMLKNVESI